MYHTSNEQKNKKRKVRYLAVAFIISLQGCDDVYLSLRYSRSDLEKKIQGHELGVGESLFKLETNLQYTCVIEKNGDVSKYSKTLTNPLFSPNNNFILKRYSDNKEVIELISERVLLIDSGFAVCSNKIFDIVIKEFNDKGVAVAGIK